MPENVQNASAQPRITVVVPTFQRRDLVLTLLRSLDRQEYHAEFEVVVVVDGSTDGTASAVREPSWSYALRVIEHENRGLAYSRNRGAEAGRAEVLLFLDDDMEADSRLLAVHDRCHEQGAEAVLGAMPLHDKSPDTFLSRGVGRWAEQLSKDLESLDRPIRWHEVFGGHLSVRRRTFDELGGFDEAFTAAGTYGNEDLDFGVRLLARERKVVFAADAVASQYYAVDGSSNLKQWRQVGRADVALARKHPHYCEEIFERRAVGSRLHGLIGRAVRTAPRLSSVAAKLAAPPVVARLDSGKQDRPSRLLFKAIRTVVYWLGVRENGGVPARRPLRVLCYHSMTDLSNDPVLEQYGVPASRFREQVESLLELGYRFVSPAEVASYLISNTGLPRKPVLLTFDDAYQDVREVLPFLEENGISSLIFVVSGEIGGENRWDHSIGATSLKLMDQPELEEAISMGNEVGGHSRSHPGLTALAEELVESEILGCMSDLETAGLGRPRFFAYPHGENDERVRQVVAMSELTGAFTVAPGRVLPGCDRSRLPRIEVLRRDSPWRLRMKILLAGHRLDLAGWSKAVARNLGVSRDQRR